MKISKVDHTRAAVSNNGGSTIGILYTDPDRKKSQNLGERVKSLNNKAKVLYSVFNQITEKDEAKKYGSLTKSVNSVFKTCLIKRNLSVEEVLSQLRISREDVSIIDDAVSLFLRKSLKKEAEGLKAILRAAAGNRTISGTDKEKAEAFILLVRKDYTKSDFGEKVIQSITYQNMVVQPKSDGKSVLTVSQNNKGSKKQREKEGLKSFLDNYADLDESIRTDMLRRLRRLVVLYFAAVEDGVYSQLPDCVDRTDFNVWESHESGKHTVGRFVEPPSDAGIIDDKGKKVRAKEKAFNDKLASAIHDRNMLCYRYAVKAVENNPELFFDNDYTNKFWIHHIENAVERILDKASYKAQEKLNMGYLQEKVWKDVLNYISIKYIAVGKAVFNYTLDDMYTADKDMNLGDIPEKAIDGFSSFDYEIIKANETLQREMAVQVAFSANNLARATVNIPESEKKEDFLLWNQKDIKENRKSDDSVKTIKSILQFFGGASTWDMNMFTSEYGDGADVSLLYDLKSMIYALRNESFHFTTANINQGTWNRNVIMQMFKKDAAACVVSEKNKFYSNNLTSFYSEKDLRGVLDRIYSRHAIRQSQVPSFNSVVVRKNLMAFLADALHCSPSFSSVAAQNMWHSAVYYLFKEIYYNDFLPSGDARNLFFDALSAMKKSDEYRDDEENKDKKKNKKKNAIDNFSRRCEELRNLSLSEICQAIMTEYNYQNQGNMKVKSGRAQAKNPDIFQHYKLLLLTTLRNAFGLFIKQNQVYSFIISPSEREKGSAEDFCKDWSSKKYDKLTLAVEGDPGLQEWYITSRFLNGRSLSLLSGTVKSYIQYVRDVARRAKQTGNVLYRDEHEKAEYCEKIVQVLELSTQLSSIFTNVFEDYFDSQEEYAEYLSQYLDYGYNGKGESAVHYLSAFCSQGDIKYKIYMDDMNPVLNRNIIMAKLFGPDKILEAIVRRVSDEDIKEYYSQQDKIAGYMAKGTCDSNEEQQSVLDYSRIKNRVELREIVEYSELINELLGQLVNWSFMRERDLLYFQLGFHYTCLKNGEKLPEQYRCIILENGHSINGAILYQIAAMYINGIAIYSADDKENQLVRSDAFSTGSKIGAFCAYSKYLLKDTGYSNTSNVALYNAGLEVFENINEHDNITDVRNAIDHFKYYSGNAGSILDLYSEVFDRFFTYDMKYQKNVGNLLSNILMGHFVYAKLEFGTGAKLVGKNKKTRAQIEIATEGLISEEFTYKLKSGEYKTAAKSKDFLETVGRILYYPKVKAGLAYERTPKKNEQRSDRLDRPNRPNYVSKKEREEGSKRLDEYKKKNSGGGSVGTSLGDLFKGLNL